MAFDKERYECVFVRHGRCGSTTQFQRILPRHDRLNGTKTKEAWYAPQYIWAYIKYLAWCDVSDALRFAVLDMVLQ